MSHVEGMLARLRRSFFRGSREYDPDQVIDEFEEYLRGLPPPVAIVRGDEPDPPPDPPEPEKPKRPLWALWRK